MNRIKSSSESINLPRLGLGHISDKNPAGQEESIRTIQTAIDNGIRYLNTADFYDSGAHEMLISEVLKTRKREDVFLSVKFGSLVAPDGRYYGIDVRPQAVKNYLAYTLKRLGTDYVDLYQPARINPNIPVEETIGAVADLVKEGYVRHVGISEVDGNTLRRANEVHPISLVEMQYSLLNRNIENDLLPVARELGIGVVAFANLFHGLISSNMSEKLEAMSKRIVPATLDKLKGLVPRIDLLNNFAAEKGMTIQQLAIAWVLAQGNDIMALVGSRTVKQLRDTMRVDDIKLSKEDLIRIEEIIPKSQADNTIMLPINVDKNGLFVK